MLFLATRNVQNVNTRTHSHTTSDPYREWMGVSQCHEGVYKCREGTPEGIARLFVTGAYEVSPNRVARTGTSYGT